MTRKLLAVGVSTLCLTFGAASALATGVPAPPSGDNTASQSNATSQLAPVAVSAPITVPVNAAVPIAVGGSNGDVSQENTTAVDGSATNNETEQVTVQQGSGGSGDNSASQSNATSQLAPVAVSAPITVPVNAAVPIAVGGSNGDVSQENTTAVDGSASNNETDQVIVQGAGSHGKKGGSGSGDNSASQSNATSQILPIALAAPITAPLNVAIPVALLGSNGDVTQTNTTAVDGSATNNETDQVIVQGLGSGSDTKGGDAAAQEDETERSGITQTNTTLVDGSATNNETVQVILQDGSGDNSASQSNATSQLLPIALAAPVTLPVNLAVPVAIALPTAPELPLPALPLPALPLA